MFLISFNKKALPLRDFDFLPGLCDDHSSALFNLYDMLMAVTVKRSMATGKHFKKPHDNIVRAVIGPDEDLSHNAFNFFLGYWHFFHVDIFFNHHLFPPCIYFPAERIIPGRAPVCFPFSTITTPFTITYTSPLLYWWGSEKVAWSPKLLSSKTVRSA
jgi:hypothetical protein